MKKLLRRGLAVAAASVTSLGLLSAVASLGDDGRATLAQAKEARPVLLAARMVGHRR